MYHELSPEVMAAVKATDAARQAILDATWQHTLAEQALRAVCRTDLHKRLLGLTWTWVPQINHAINRDIEPFPAVFFLLAELAGDSARSVVELDGNVTISFFDHTLHLGSNLFGAEALGRLQGLGYNITMPSKE